MPRQKTLFVLVLALLLCTTATVAWADSQARIVRLSYIEGNVQMDRGDGNGYIRAFLNMPVIEGTRLLTGPDARTEVEFEDGSTIRLIPDTIVFFSQLRLTDSGDKNSLLDVQQGMAYIDVKHRKEDYFHVTSGRLEMTPLKSSRFRVSNTGAEFNVAVFNGELEYVNADGQRVSLRKNETLNIDFADPSRYYLARGTTEEANDYWDKERESDRQTYARRASYGNNPNGYYLNELSPFGSFMIIGSYGSMWRPSNVGINWDPFDFGSWVYYPGAGYMWVSGYAWGWTPFRYGSWIYVSNMGWYWRPATAWNDWYPVPHLINAPPGYVLPVRPIVGVHPVTIISGRRGLDPLDRLEDHDRLGSGDHRVFVQDRVRPNRDLARGDFVPARPPAAVIPPATGGVSSDRVRSPRVIGTDSVVPAGGSATGDTSGRIRPARNSDSVAPITPIRTNDTAAPTPRVRDVPPRPSEAPPRVVDQSVRPQKVENPPQERPRSVEPRPAPATLPASAPPPAQPPIVDRPSRPQRVDPPPPPPPQASVKPTERTAPPQK